MTKKVFKDALIILGVAAAFGIFYNWMNPKGLGPLYYVKEKPKLDDSALFGAPPNGDNVSIDTLKADTVKFTDKKLDTALVAKNEPASVDNLEFTVSYEQMKRLIKDNRFYIIDARAPEVYSEGHIQGSHNIHPYLEDADEYMRLIFSVPRDKKIVIYCDGGNCDLSHKVADDLKTGGYSQIFLYAGGWNEWSAREKKK